MSQNNNSDKLTYEFDLIEFVSVLWNRRLFILLLSTCCLTLSVVYLLLTNKEYTTYSELISLESSNSSTGLSKLGGLAGLAGIDLGGSPTGLSSAIYPEVVESVPFKLQLLDSVLYFSELDTQLTIRDYFVYEYFPTWDMSVKKYTIGLPKLILRFFRSETNTPQLNFIKENDVYFLGVNDKIGILGLDERVEITVLSDIGIIGITTLMPDPVAAAELNRVVLRMLKQYVTDFKLNKARENLEFIEKSYELAKVKFEKAQVDLAEFNDRNRNVVTSTARIENRNLENKYNIAFNIFSSVSSQLEQAKISLNEETPVFAILDPVVAPTSESEPNAPIILIASTLLGFLIALSYLFLQMFFQIYLNNNRKS